MSRGGSQPDPTVRQRVIDALMDLIAEEGLANATIDRIAARADISKATLYTRWPDRDALVIDTFAQITTGAPVADDATGGFDEQMAALAERAASRNDRFRRLLAEIVLLAAHRESVHEYLAQFQQGWRDRLAALVALGKSEGRVPADRDDGRTVEVVMAVITMRALYGDLPPEEIPELLETLLTSEHPM